ncbi:MAG: hypothetical protein NVS2B16_16910 [Chloroflexota bacterium]
MIVRVSGMGQFELDDDGVHRLNELDDALTAALDGHDEPGFHRLLHDTIEFVRTTGKPLDHARLTASNVIIPPEDVDIHEARRFFTDDGLMAPLLA